MGEGDNVGEGATDSLVGRVHTMEEVAGNDEMTYGCSGAVRPSSPSSIRHMEYGAGDGVVG